jgi:hypothetical protein
MVNCQSSIRLSWRSKLKHGQSRALLCQDGYQGGVRYYQARQDAPGGFEPARQGELSLCDLRFEP